MYHSTNYIYEGVLTRVRVTISTYKYFGDRLLLR